MRKRIFKWQGLSLKSAVKIFLFTVLFLIFLFVLKFYYGNEAQSNKPVLPSPYKWKERASYIYKFDYSSTSFSDFRILFGDLKNSKTKEKDMPGLAFSFETSVKGELATTIIEFRKNDILAVFKIQNPIVILITNGYQDIQQAEVVKAELEKDVFALISPQGKILSVLFDPSTGDLAQNYFRAILSLRQFVFPGEEIPQSNQWELEEEDPSGQYIASYKICKVEDTKINNTPIKLFCKRKIRYLEDRSEVKKGTIEIPKIIIPGGEFIANFDFANGNLTSLEGVESQTILIQSKKVGQVTNRFQLTFLKQEDLNNSEINFLKNRLSEREKKVKGVSLYVKPSRETLEASIHKRELGEATLESLLAELQKAESEYDSGFDATALYLKFKSLIYLYPESCKILGKVLSQADANSLTMRLLPKALSTIGHPQAQEALVEAIKAHLSDRRALFTLINTLATVNEPTEQAEEMLKNLAFHSKDPEIAAMAQLALGAQARRIANFSTERAEKIVDQFIKEIKRSSSPEITKQLLLALGNAGSSRALPEILELAKSTSPDLRSIALHALRFIDSPEAEAMLIKALQSDGENSVRLVAANTLGFRRMTEASFRAQKEVFWKDRSIDVRLKVLDNLAKAEQVFPEVRHLIKRAASEDPSEEVRKAAEKIISQYTGNQFK